MPASLAASALRFDSTRNVTPIAALAMPPATSPPPSRSVYQAGGGSDGAGSVAGGGKLTGGSWTGRRAGVCSHKLMPVFAAAIWSSLGFEAMYRRYSGIA